MIAGAEEARRAGRAMGKSQRRRTARTTMPETKKGDGVSCEGG
jgi:hypothetical protein